MTEYTDAHPQGQTKDERIEELEGLVLSLRQVLAYEARVIYAQTMDVKALGKNRRQTAPSAWPPGTASPSCAAARTRTATAPTTARRSTGCARSHSKISCQYPLTLPLLWCSFEGVGGKSPRTAAS